MPTLRSQASRKLSGAGRTKKPTHDQNQPKSLPTQTHGQKDNVAKMKENETRKINNETLTKAICNKGFSGNSSILPRINFCVGRQESSPQSLTAHSQTDSAFFVDTTRE